jgi:hypothetical protein
MELVKGEMTLQIKNDQMQLGTEEIIDVEVEAFTPSEEQENIKTCILFTTSECHTRFSMPSD